jgi:hypothetical protein
MMAKAAMPAAGQDPRAKRSPPASGSRREKAYEPLLSGKAGRELVDEELIVQLEIAGIRAQEPEGISALREQVEVLPLERRKPARSDSRVALHVCKLEPAPLTRLAKTTGQ